MSGLISKYMLLNKVKTLQFGGAVNRSGHITFSDVVGLS